MDSLHPSLSQALPLRDYDADQALQAPFRAAALGIATFYKRAAENGRKAYCLGYSSALQDVLAHLQTALDQSDSQHSGQTMALAITRVMDYIQRRQEALRAESQEPNEDDHSPNPPASQHQPQRQSTTPSARSTLSPTSAHAQPSETNSAAQEASSSAAMVSSESCPPTVAVHSPRRRTSPRRMTSVTFHQRAPQESSEPPVGEANPERTSQPTSLSSSSSTPSILNQPINLDFSSFAATPLPQQLQQASSVVSTNNPSTRRHRTTPVDGGTRKGKLKERSSGLSGGISLESATAFFPPHHGYAHYSPSNTASCSDDSKPISTIGTKRRFPVESTFSLHEGNPSSAAPVRITRRSNSNRSLTASIEEAESTTGTHHHHDGQINPDDVVMVLQGNTNEGELERASKRLFSYKNVY